MPVAGSGFWNLQCLSHQTDAGWHRQMREVVMSHDTINKHSRSCSFLPLTTTACTVTIQSCAVPEQLSLGLYELFFAAQGHFSPVWFPNN